MSELGEHEKQTKKNNNEKPLEQKEKSGGVSPTVVSHDEELDRLRAELDAQRASANPEYEKKYSEIAQKHFDVGFLSGHGKSLIESAKSDMPSNATILEIGANTGEHVKQLKKAFSDKTLRLLD